MWKFTVTMLDADGNVLATHVATTPQRSWKVAFKDALLTAELTYSDLAWIKMNVLMEKA